ncbi:MAG: nucleotide sugar dehydrogenase [Geminicoccaceae bacterium]|nr:nucleotide sugar dehydrogenase [Geminicoccaceae bacterium]
MSPSRTRPLRAAVLGLGRVGLVTAASLAAAGHRVFALDRRAERLAQVARGRLPWREPGLDELLRTTLDAGTLALRADLEPISAELDLLAICVETPLGADDRLDVRPLCAALAEVGRLLSRRPRTAAPLLLVLRSTVPPGATETRLLPGLVEASGRAPGEGFELALNPEFLREGSALADHRAPARIVIGERRPGASGRLLGIYEGAAAPVFEVGYREAETIKLVDNAFHALKVAFANEIGRLAFGLGLLPARLAELFLADGKLNLSAAYLRPGAPYGGPCLPKDLRALLATARACALELPVLRAVEASNRLHLAFLVERIAALVPPPGPLFLLGLAFKEGVEDVRGSPQLELLAQLAARDYAIEVFDPDLEPEDALAVERGLPAGARLHGRGAVEAALAGARLVILAKRPPDLLRRLPPGLPIVDLLRLDLPDPRERSPRTTRGAA